MIVSTYNLSKDQWLFTLEMEKTTYRTFENVCTITKILSFVVRSLIQEAKFKAKGL